MKTVQCQELHVINDEPLAKFLANALPSLVDEPKVLEARCRCGATLRFPLTARQSDIVAFRKLIGLAEKYLEESGVTDKMLAEIMTKIRGALLT